MPVESGIVASFPKIILSIGEEDFSSSTPTQTDMVRSCASNSQNGSVKNVVEDPDEGKVKIDKGKGLVSGEKVDNTDDEKCVNLKRGEENLHPPITLLGFEWVRSDVRKFQSKFLTSEDMTLFSKNGAIDDQVVVEHCSSYEYVFLSSSSYLLYTYVYKCLFKDLGVTIPFSSFECEFLTKANVAPTQLHPNSWGFLRAFQILCTSLGIEPTLHKFMHFYQLKFGMPIGWISLRGVHNKGLFTLFSQSYKNFKNEFFKVRPVESRPELDTIFHKNGKPKFPFYWQAHPSRFTGTNGVALSKAEVEDIEKLKELPRPLDCKAILLLPHSSDLQRDLESIIGKNDWPHLKAKFNLDKDVPRKDLAQHLEKGNKNAKVVIPPPALHFKRRRMTTYDIIYVDEEVTNVEVEKPEEKTEKLAVNTDVMNAEEKINASQETNIAADDANDIVASREELEKVKSVNDDLNKEFIDKNVKDGKLVNEDEF